MAGLGEGLFSHNSVLSAPGLAQKFSVCCAHLRGRSWSSAESRAGAGTEPHPLKPEPLCPKARAGNISRNSALKKPARIIYHKSQAQVFFLPAAKLGGSWARMWRANLDGSLSTDNSTPELILSMHFPKDKPLQSKQTEKGKNPKQSQLCCNIYIYIYIYIYFYFSSPRVIPIPGSDVTARMEQPCSRHDALGILLLKPS